MTTELIAFLVMVGVFLLGCFLCKLPVSLSMVLASVSRARSPAGRGLRLASLVEKVCLPMSTQSWSLPRR